MKYIYESPDGGKTIFRHPFGFPDKREQLVARPYSTSIHYGPNGPESMVIEDLVISIENQEKDG